MIGMLECNICKTCANEATNCVSDPDEVLCSVQQAYTSQLDENLCFPYVTAVPAGQRSGRGAAHEQAKFMPYHGSLSQVAQALCTQCIHESENHNHTLHVKVCSADKQWTMDEPARACFCRLAADPVPQPDHSAHGRSAASGLTPVMCRLPPAAFGLPLPPAAAAACSSQTQSAAVPSCITAGHSSQTSEPCQSD